MMGEVGSAFGGMIVPVTVIMKIIVNMQGQHAAMGLAQDVNDGRTVGTRKCDRGTEDTKRIGGDQQGCPPASQCPGRANPHCFQTKRADNDSIL